MTAIHTFEDIHRRDREAAHKSYTATPGFPVVEAKAKAKGFRHATLQEIHGSAGIPPGSLNGPELHSYRGGLLVRLEAIHG